MFNFVKTLFVITCCMLFLIVINLFIKDFSKELVKKEQSMSVFKLLEREIPGDNIKEVYLWIDGLTSENFYRLFKFFNYKKDFIIKEIYPNYNNEIIIENKIVIENSKILEALATFVKRYHEINNSDEDTIIPIKAVKIQAKNKDIVSFLKQYPHIKYSSNMEGPYQNLRP